MTISEDMYLDLLRIVLNRCENISDTLMTVQLECTRLLEENRALKSRPYDLGIGYAMHQVHEFRRKFEQPVLSRPGFPDFPTQELAYVLVKEEFNEFADAWHQSDLIELADAMADLIYVILGAALAYGIPLAPIFDEVHRTNMAKEKGGKDERGKILKPEGWQPPDIKRILEEAAK